ncbi:HNH endonuclease [Yersinia intermedia]|uniref:HNH endonuclease n=1 Tax=Yersinia intermedia TaxID=631 RepID=A0A0T9MS58_YERIN|nr:HNH endonuclease [Yersinia intermedia]CNG42170.1 Uncharacterised protein [Yersinia intermedia]
MAICKRNDCKYSVGQFPAERELRLCSEHYQRRLSYAAKRDIKQGLTCQYPPCGISLSNTRNHRYCCNEHRNKSRRLIDDDAIVNLVKHSYWINVESLLKNNPLGIGSIKSPNDIVDLIRLYQRKAAHQKAYNTINGLRITDSYGVPLKRLIPWFELELCHIYPNSKGGSNTLNNIIIAPALINRKMKDSVPVCTSGGVFRGIKAVDVPIPIKYTLLKALTDQYGALEVQQALSPVKHVNFLAPDVLRRLFGTNIYAHPPMLKLLKEEVSRLNLWDLLESIDHITKSPWLSAGPANELFAVAAFHAMLNGDADKFLEIFSGLREDMNVRARDQKTLIYADYQNILDQYMVRYFNLDLHDQEACNIFYNSFFTVKPLDKRGILVTPS